MTVTSSSASTVTDAAATATVTDLSMNAGRARQDEAARRVLLVLQGKDADIRRLEADVAELRNAERDLSAELAEVRAERNAAKEKLHTVVADNYTDGVQAERLGAEVAFLENERAVLMDEKQVVVQKLRAELDVSNQLRQQLQAAAVQRIGLQRQVEEMTDAAAYHASIIENLQEQLELEKEETGDRHAELTVARENAASERAGLADQLRSLQSQAISANQKTEAQVREQRATQAKLDRSTAEANALRERLGDLRAQMDADASRLEEREHELAEAQAEVKQLTERVAGQKAALDLKSAEHIAAIDALDALKATAQQLEGEMREAHSENARLREALAQRAADRAGRQAQAVELETLEHDNAVLREKLSTAVRDAAVMEREAVALRNDFSTNAAALADAHTAIDILKAEQAHLREQNARMEALEADVAGLTKKLHTEQRKHADAVDTAQHTQTELLELHRTFGDHQAAARAMNDDFQRQLAGRDAEVEEKTQVVEGLQRQVRELDDALTAERESVGEHHREVLNLRRENDRLLTLVARAKKERKRAKQERQQREEDEVALREEVKRRSEDAVQDMRAQQDLVSALTTARDDAGRRIATLERRQGELELAHAAETVALREELAKWQAKHDAGEEAAAAAARAAEKALSAERKRHGETAGRAAELEEEVGTLTAAAKDAREERRVLEKKVEDAEAKAAKLKNVATRQENRLRALEGRLQAAQEGDAARHSVALEKERERGALSKRSADDDKRRQALIAELRAEKSRLATALADATDRARQAEDRLKLLQCSSARTTKLLAQYRGGGGGDASAPTTPQAHQTKHDVEAAAKEWQAFVMAQLTTLSGFLVRSTLEVIESVQALRRAKGDAVRGASFGMFDAATSQALYDTTLLTPGHYTNLIRLATGYTKGCLAAAPTPRVAGGLGDSATKRPPELAGVFTELVLRRVKLEADLASLTAL